MVVDQVIAAPREKVGRDVQIPSVTSTEVERICREAIMWNV
jgi:hypothetical protein